MPLTLEEAEAILEDQFLQAYGDREMTRLIFVPGEDHSQELAQTEQSLERLRWESDNGLVDDESLYRSRLTALVARKAELTANTVVPARWEPVGTGRTYRELWGDESTDRRQVLRSMKDKLRHGFNLSIAELDDGIVWNRATLGVAAISSSTSYLTGQLQQIDQAVHRIAAGLSAEVIDSYAEILPE